MEADNIVEWLLEQDPSVALQWLQERVEGTQPLPEDFSWYGLTELAASDTFHKQGKVYPVPNLGWAKVAVFAHRYLIDQEKHSSRLAHKPDRKKFTYLGTEVSLMRVQARCILAYGPIPGDAVLDVNSLLACFFDDLPFSPDEILALYQEKGKAWLAQEHRELVRIRMKLEILQMLKEKQVLPANQDLQRWFAVWDQVHF